MPVYRFTIDCVIAGTEKDLIGAKDYSFWAASEWLDEACIDHGPPDSARINLPISDKGVTVIFQWDIS